MLGHADGAVKTPGIRRLEARYGPPGCGSRSSADGDPPLNIGCHCRAKTIG
jgi:hypothetical protein